MDRKDVKLTVINAHSEKDIIRIETDEREGMANCITVTINNVERIKIYRNSVNLNDEYGILDYCP